MTRSPEEWGDRLMHPLVDRQDVRYAVVVPAAPRDDVVDTVASIRHYEPDVLIVVINDSPTPLRIDGALVLPALPWPKGSQGSLLCKELWAFDLLLQWTSVDIVLRLDADALILRAGGFGEVEAVFRHDPAVGAAGSFRVGPDGGVRDFAPAARVIRRRGGVRSLLHPRGRAALRSLHQQAAGHGYEDGAHALGASLYLRRSMLEAWRASGLLRLWSLADLAIADDVLLGLLCYSSGYRLADIGGPEGLIAVSWRGLPMSPEHLMERGVYVTHSVRSWGDDDERVLRELFRLHREPGTTGEAAPGLPDR